MAHIDYVVVSHWKVLPNTFACPRRIIFLDTLTCELVTTLYVGDDRLPSERDWHIPEEYLISFLASDFFKTHCLLQPEGRQPVLGTNDPVVWNLLTDLQMNMEWLGGVALDLYLPLLLRAVKLANFVRDKKMLDWACEYLETREKVEEITEKEEEETKNEEQNNSRWKRVGNRLSSPDTEE